MSNLMLLYNKIVPVSRNDHKSLKLKPLADFKFAANTHWVPVAGAEFYRAAHSFPIVFAGDQGAITPILMLGLQSGHNDFVDSYFQWKKDAYVPAFIRRYPFVLADTGAANKDLTVCLDSECAAFSETEGRELFKEDGSNGELFDEILNFMKGFTIEMERTKSFVEAIQKHDLLIKRNANIRSATGETFQVQDFLAIDEEKFNKLSGDVLESFHQQGFLGWIFAHLMSLNTLTNLFDLHLANKAVIKSKAN